MPRKFLEASELVTLLNIELGKHEECKDCRFGQIVLLLEPDSEGCNWSEPFLRCSGQPVVVCTPIARRVLDVARSQFNIT